MTYLSPVEREQVAVTAHLLDQGRLIHGAALVLMAVATIAVLITPANPWALGVLIIGLIELTLAIRVSFDAALFHRIAATGDAIHLDQAMNELTLMPTEKAGRPWLDRCHGARRLLTGQALALTAQCVLVVAFATIGANGSAFL